MPIPHSGSQWTVRYAEDLPNGESSAKRQLDGKDFEPADLKAIQRFLRTNCEKDRLPSGSHYKKIEGDLWELKPTDQVRLGVFREGRVLHVCIAFKKKSDKWPRSKIDAALDAITRAKRRW